MKKIFTAVLIVLAFFVLAGCTNQKAVEGTSAITIEGDTTPKLVEFNMEESEIRELYLKLYAEKQKVSNLISEKKEAKNFISDEDAKMYEKYGLVVRNYKEGFVTSYNKSYNETRNYYYPIIISGTDGKTEVVFAYTDENGNLCIYNATQDSHDYFRNIHVPEYTDFIDSCSNHSVVYTNNHVQVWEFGQKKFEANVPLGSNYVGFSYWEGYIFRNSGDVYSVNFKTERIINKEKPEEEPKVITTFVCEAIAHGVKEVIAPDYKLNSDAWSQPLFLMNDGSLKAYCQWHGDREAPSDDECHLSAPQYEGGWK